MNISILGYYTTAIGELWDRSLDSLFQEAQEGAIKKAEIDAHQVEAVFVANKAAGSFSGQRHLSALISEMFDHCPPAMRVEGACASGGLATLAARQALQSGEYQTVMVIGAEKMTDSTVAETTSVLSSAANFDNEHGSTFPGLYALLAVAHQRQFGTTREQLSAVAVKNHRHALQNPLAQYQAELTIEQVSSSQLVADPLRLLDCSPVSDGASAIILSTKKVGKKPKIIGWGHAQDSLDLAGRKKLTELKATCLAAKKAYDIAGKKPRDIQQAEVHDCFTIAEIMAIEDLGFFKKGKGGVATANNQTTLGASLVVNGSGGLKAFGHPVGATGLKQIAYLASQVEKGQCDLALAHNVGGSGATAVVHIISH
ncbi:MAG TPA: beta-ketoacyl synthase N-terminal-like domain-containing protein [Candidatus Woesebacteria bacterium]|nr:beta-ketoacyl synthase N-terminal-like domain-containing protein [Candidatus Woesebacteria bacterium]